MVNMLMGMDVAPTTDGALGCALSSTAYRSTIGDQRYTFWDTVGLNESDIGTVPDLEAVVALYHLLRKLDGGVSLLVFCMRKPKNAWTAAQQNWELFKHIIGQDKVPAVIAVTHLEQENMDTWWMANQYVFAQHKIVPSLDVRRRYLQRGTPCGGRAIQGGHRRRMHHCDQRETPPGPPCSARRVQPVVLENQEAHL